MMNIASLVCISVLLVWGIPGNHAEENLMDLANKFAKCNGEDTGIIGFAAFGGGAEAAQCFTPSTPQYCVYKCALEKLKILQGDKVNKARVIEISGQIASFSKKDELLGQGLYCIKGSLDTANECASTKKAYNCFRNVFERVCAGYKGKGTFVNDDGTIEGDAAIVD